MRFKALRVCQSKGFSVVPQEVVRYDLAKAADILEKDGYEVSPSEVMVLATKEGVEVSLYVNGRLMVQPVESKDMAISMAEGFYARIDGAREPGSG